MREFGKVAQLVERMPEEHSVAGSIPALSIFAPLVER